MDRYLLQAQNPVLQLLLNSSHFGKLSFFIFCKTSIIQGIPDFFHHRVVKIQVMKDTKAHTKHFLCLQQMADIGAGITAAGRAGTPLFYRPVIRFILGIEQIDFAVISI